MPSAATSAERTAPTTTASKTILSFTGTVLSARFREQPGRVTRVVAPASDVATYCCGRSERSKLAASWNLRGGGASPSTGSSASSVVPTGMSARSVTRRAGAASSTTTHGRSTKLGTQSSRDTGSTPSARRQASRSSSSSTGKVFASDPARTPISTSTTCRPASQRRSRPRHTCNPSRQCGNAGASARSLRSTE
jgi:hypothetical protein